MYSVLISATFMRFFGFDELQVFVPAGLHSVHKYLRNASDYSIAEKEFAVRTTRLIRGYNAATVGLRNSYEI